jgi:hypothetical protein
MDVTGREGVILVKLGDMVMVGGSLDPEGMARFGWCEKRGGMLN